MKEYKDKGELAKACEKLGMKEGGYEQSRKDCDFVLRHFFRGNWGYPTMLEWMHLHNAIQMSGPEDFDDELIRERFRNIARPVSVIIEVTEQLSTGNGNAWFEFRLEEERNYNGSPDPSRF